MMSEWEESYKEELTIRVSSADASKELIVQSAKDLSKLKEVFDSNEKIAVIMHFKFSNTLFNKSKSNCNEETLKQGSSIDRAASSCSSDIPSAPAPGFHFQFPHSNLFPRQILDVLNNDLNEYYDASSNPNELPIGDAVNEFHASLSKGTWNEKEWGKPMLEIPVSEGATVSAWIKHKNTTESTQYSNNKKSSNYHQMSTWEKMTRSLSGLFCVSFSEVNDDNSVIMKEEENSIALHHGSLPSESSCTENLSPFLLLLPCREKQGFGSMIDPLNLFQSEYHTMQLSARKVKIPRNQSKFGDSFQSKWWSTEANERPDDYKFGLEFTQSVVMVNKITARDVIKVGDMLARSIEKCPAADESIVYVERTKKSIEFDPQPKECKDLGNSFERCSYDVGTCIGPDCGNSTISLDIAMEIVDKSKMIPIVSSVTHERFGFGVGEREGGIAMILQNQESIPLNISINEVIPSFLSFHPGSIKIVVVDENKKPYQFSQKETIAAIRQYKKSTKKGISPMFFQIDFTMPQRSSAVFEYTFGKKLLSIVDSKPDPNRGFDVPSSTIYISSNMNGFANYSIETSPVLVTLLLPDYSMPFNVITLTSTLLAFVFGSIVNILTRVRQKKKDKSTNNKSNTETKND